MFRIGRVSPNCIQGFAAALPLAFFFFLSRDLVIKKIKQQSKTPLHTRRKREAGFTKQLFQNHDVLKTIQNVERRGKKCLMWVASALQLLLIKAPLYSLWASFQQKIL